MRAFGVKLRNFLPTDRVEKILPGDIGKKPVRHIVILIVATSLPLVGFATSQAQTSPRSHYTDGVVGQFDDAASDMLLESATVSAKFTTPTADRPATLMITAKIARGRHTYSLTQPPGGPQPTTIELQPSPNYRQLSSFRSQPAPKAHQEDLGAGTSIKVEEHEGQVTWYAPIELTAGVDPKALEIRGSVHMQVCQTHGICEPVNKDFVARQAASADAANSLPAPVAAATASPIEPSQSGPFQLDGSEVKLEGRIVPSAVRPGQSAELEITATPPASGHLYAHADRDNKLGTKPVLFAIETATGLVPHRPKTDAPTKTENSPYFGALLYHDAPVTWKIRLDVPEIAKPGNYPISGLMGYQACEFEQGKSQCERPSAVRFSGTLIVGEQSSTAASPIAFAPFDKYSLVAEAAAVFADNFDRQSSNSPANTSQKTASAATASVTKSPNDTELPRPDSQTPVLRATDQYELNRIVLGNSATGSLSYYIALAFVGGLILNLMPCVLPVIGLKVMSFVEQSGKSRANALLLNLWFGAGIVSVFLLLGLLAATARPILGRPIRQHCFQCHDRRRCVRDGAQPARRVGSPHPRFLRQRLGQLGRLERRSARCLPQRRRHDRARHTVYSSVHGLRNRLGCYANRSPQR